MKKGKLKTGEEVEIIETEKEFVDVSLKLHYWFKRLTVSENYQMEKKDEENLVKYFNEEWKSKPDNILIGVSSVPNAPHEPYIININKEQIMIL